MKRKPPVTPRGWITAKEFRKMMPTVSARTIRHWCKLGVIPSRKVGRDWHVDMEGVLKMLSAKKEPNPYEENALEVMSTIEEMDEEDDDETVH